MARYLLQIRPGEYVIGTPSEVLNRGNQEDFPSFTLEGGANRTFRREDVITELKDDEG